jgi:hypothetical protein
MSVDVIQDRKRLSQNELILYLSLIAIAALLVCVYYLRRGIYSPRIGYNIVDLLINYIQFGAVRRGLSGSIVYLSRIDLAHVPFVLYGVSAVSFVVASFFLLRRMTAYAIEYIPFLIFLAGLLLFWSAEMGKTDIVVAVVLIAMALALVNGQIVLASVLLVIGVLVHEVCAIYGLPLLAALLIDDGRYKQFKWRSFAWSAAVLAAGAILYEATMMLPRSSNSVIVATIESELRSIQLDPSLVPQAFYFHLGGARAVKTAMCIVDGSNNRTIQLLITLTMVAVAIISLSGTRPAKWVLPVFVSAPSILFLWLTGLDMSRWVALGILNVWIFCAIRNFAPFERESRRFVWASVFCAAAMAVILYPKTVYVSGNYLYPSPILEKVLEMAVGRPTYKTQEECDPTWRSLLSQD